jgi:hypothetical protein
VDEDGDEKPERKIQGGTRIKPGFLWLDLDLTVVKEDHRDLI